MAKITKDLIVKGAQRMIEQEGYDNFSFRELAYRLGVQPSALYNHLKNVRDLEDAISLIALEELDKAIQETIRNLHGKEALLMTAKAIRSFAQARPELFRTIERGGKLEKSAALFVHTKDQLDQFSLTAEDEDRFTNAFHAAIFGFLMMERRHMLLRSEEAEESFTTMIALLLSNLHPTRRVN